MSAVSLTATAEAMHQQFEAIKIADRARDEFIQNLIQEAEKMRKEQEEIVKTLRAKEMLAVTYQDRFEAAEKQRLDLQRAVDCDRFVLVLIDGDDTLFKDEYIKDGLPGGERAARDLRQALFDYFKDKEYFKHDYKIITKIYWQQVGLGKTYHDAAITSGLNALSLFVQGFNKTDTLMDIIDAGNGKGGADSKIEAGLELFNRNLHCKQIVLAGSGDNDYGGLLRRHTPGAGKSNRITLIEALPFTREIRALCDKFEIVRFDGIFRDTKIVVKEAPHQENTFSPLDPPWSNASTASQPSASATVASTTGTVNNNPVSMASGAEETRPAQMPRGNSASPIRVSSYIWVNRLDQRIDPPIKNINKELFLKLKQRKLCNKYYLEKDCPYTFCLHNHDLPLKDVELEHLRYVARLKACSRGLDCDNANCIDGHRCQYGTRCDNWKAGECFFSDAMHKVETHDVKKVPAKV